MKSKRKIYMFILLLIPYMVFSQKGIINNGSLIVINQGGSVILGQDMEIYNQGTGLIALDGTIELKSDITNNANNGLFNSPDDKGILKFVGVESQYIKGTERVAFDNVHINCTGVYLNNNVTHLGNLNMINGNIYLNDYSYLLGANTSVTGILSEDNMFVINGLGELRRKIVQPGLYPFPIGTEKDLLQYSPLDLSVATISINSNDSYIGSYVVNQKYTYNQSSSEYLNRYWTLSSSGISSIEFDAAFYYTDDDIVGNESNIYGTVFNNTGFDVQNKVNTISNSFEITEQTTLEIYTGTDGLTSINDINQNTFHLYPNPTSDKLYIIHNSKLFDDMFIKLIDQQGNEIKHYNYEDLQQRESKMFSLNFCEISPGMYYLIFSNQKKQVFKKIIKN